MGISVSELMRRAVLNFNATSEQIKAAGIVERLRAPKAPDPLDLALKSVAAKAAAREAREAAAQATRNASRTTARAQDPGIADDKLADNSETGLDADAPLSGRERS